MLRRRAHSASFGGVIRPGGGRGQVLLDVTTAQARGQRVNPLSFLVPMLPAAPTIGKSSGDAIHAANSCTRDKRLP